MSDSTVRAQAAGMPVRTIRLSVEGTEQEAIVSDGERLTVGSASGNDLIIDDKTVSRFHLTLSREAAAVALTDLGSTNGTKIGPVTLRDGTATLTLPASLQLGQVSLRLADGDVVMQKLHEEEALGGLRGKSPPMRRLMADIQKLAASDVSVLQIGESGTGKELIARAIHDNSARAGKPFVVVDCAAIPPSLFAAELFGHERGAFTGADRRRAGALERAHGGTIFLDELGELPPSLQASLLGALERRRFTRLGGADEVPVDVRIVSATNRDLRKDVNSGNFRLDLFYRLGVVVLEIPPLRKRTEDIPMLLEHFAAEAGAEADARELFTPEIVQQLTTYPWPGNVRELRNLVAGTVAMGRQPSLESVSMMAPDSGDGDAIESVLHLGYRDARGALLEQFERRYLEQLLQRSDGNVRKAARVGQMNRSYLIELLKRHEIR
ncbi:MAG TPA: sigma 54-interacting transcriptional regulator [Polyangiaceae bacterium]|nr:sigma 54-interacting transcriptional regulator [Polyangiaceae bacterium]